MPSSRRWLSFVVPLLAGAVYVATASPHVLGGDCGEFATLLATGGVAHPPGFPLYVLLLRAFRFVPAESPAHAAALLSAVTATVAVYVVGAAARAFGASPAAAALAAAAYAAAALTWQLATHAEVFSQAELFAGLIVLASAPRLGSRGARRAALLGLVAGLALATHLALLFLAPVGVHAFVRACREGRASRGIVAGALGLAGGLLPFAFIVYSARTSDPLREWVWGNPVDLAGLLRHVGRADYGSLQLSASSEPSNPVGQLRLFLESVVPGFLGLPIFALLGGAVSLRRERLVGAPSASRAPVLALSAAAFTMGICFIGMFNRPLIGVGPQIVERFYGLPMVPVAVLAALAFDVLVPAILQRAVGAALPLLVLSSGFAWSADTVREYTRPSLQYFLDDVLAVVPPGTVIVGNGDHVTAGFLYALRGQRRRPDVAFLAPDLMYTSWFRRALGRQLGIAFQPPTGDGALERWIEQLHAAGRPVLFAGVMRSGFSRHFPSYPEGPLVRLLPKGAQPPPPAALERYNAQLYARFREDEPPPRSADTWSGLVHSHYAETWAALARAYGAAGDVQGARRCRERAVALAPWFAPRLPE